MGRAEAPPSCETCRRSLATRHPLPQALAAWWATPASDAESASIRRHLAACPDCRAWLDARIPAQVMDRQRRLSRYCCASMFRAVEEADARREVVVSFTMIRDEVCWTIDGKQTYARHCPWCGRGLPDRPFLEGEAASGP